tara:strand:+ start:2514 stop:3203 length:690 start_codon:yes stop_codon:yes gene_type:complete
MPILPRRFAKLKKILNYRLTDLTIMVENVHKPHNLSALIRSCDAVGVLEAHAINGEEKHPTFNCTAKGSEKWVKLRTHENIKKGISYLKKNGFKIYGTNVDNNSIDYRDCNFTEPTAFVLGAEKWGLSEEAKKMMDQNLYIPMRGMVQSLNVSVAGGVLLFEALRQREINGLKEGKKDIIKKDIYEKILFEWAYPEVAEWCKKEGKLYPKVNDDGEIIETLPRNIRMKY